VCWRLSLLLIFLFLSGCSDQNSLSPQQRSQEINGRDEGAADFYRAPIYRVKTPLGWIRKDPSPNSSIAETTKALCEFYIPGEEGNSIRITVHNFPYQTATERIPPQAQTARWKRQFTNVDPTSFSLIPQSFSGFAGLLFEATGTLNGLPTTTLGWSMQLAPEHDRVLSYQMQTHDKEDPAQYVWTQMRADITLKAQGPTEAMQQQHASIMAFARSFELIQEIPAP
jgi:hypothetical protein